jgi:hypothetical protein
MKQRSEEIEDIIERMPSKFGYVVSLLLLVLVGILLLFGFIVNYPDVLTGRIVLKKGTLPVRLVTKSYGNLKLLDGLKNGMSVKEGQYLAYFENQARVADIRDLNRILTVFQTRKDLSVLKYGLTKVNLNSGELTAKVSALKAVIQKLLSFNLQNVYLQQSAGIKKSLLKQQELLKELDLQILSRRENLTMSKSIFTRDSLLFSKDLLSQADYEKSKQTYISSYESLYNLNKEKYNLQQKLSDLNNQIDQDNVQGIDKSQDLQLQFETYFNDLAEAIKDWEQTYVLKSPIDGKLEFLKFVESNQFLRTGEEVFAVLPKEGRVVEGLIEISSVGAGKVQTNQKVVIKLEDYPYKEFGSLEGKVTNVSKLSKTVLNDKSQEASLYLVSVAIAEKPTTNFDIHVDLKPGSKGTADIITAKRKLIERIFANIKHSLKD